jgi:hypothetical protein
VATGHCSNRASLVTERLRRLPALLNPAARAFARRQVVPHIERSEEISGVWVPGS